VSRVNGAIHMTMILLSTEILPDVQNLIEKKNILRTER